MSHLVTLRRSLAAIALAAPLLAAASDAPGPLPGGPPGNPAPPNNVPEPGTWLLVGLAAAAAAGARRRK